MLVLKGSERFVDLSGLDGHCKNQLRIVTAQTLISTHKGDVIAVFHQTVFLGKGKSTLSCLQMGHYGAEIKDKSLRLPGGKQRILMDGYQIPLAFRHGLPYLPCQAPTATEAASLPHLIMTSDLFWDPKTYDSVISEIHTFYDAEADMIDQSTFDDCSSYCHRTVATHNTHPEPEYFDAHEYPDYSVVIDDLFDAHHPALLED
jgi:hypothetical protein